MFIPVCVANCYVVCCNALFIIYIYIYFDRCHALLIIYCYYQYDCHVWFAMVLFSLWLTKDMA